MAGITIRAVEKRYSTPSGKVVALAPVALDVADGEFVVLLGPSGCGKTTLLRCLAGLTVPSGGSVGFTGGGVGGRRRIGVVFQDPLLFPWMTIAENITLPLRLRGIARAARAAQAATLCQLVGIAGFEAKWPRELSGGMRQRAAIARAIAHDPEVLLMDEPFGALDAMTRDQMNLELQRLWMARGTTVVLVTHSITEALFLADRVVLMTPRPGRIACVTAVPFGRPRDLDLTMTAEFQGIARDLRGRLSHAP